MEVDADRVLPARPANDRPGKRTKYIKWRNENATICTYFVDARKSMSWWQLSCTTTTESGLTARKHSNSLLTTGVWLSETKLEDPQSWTTTLHDSAPLRPAVSGEKRGRILSFFLPKRSEKR